MIEVKIVAKTQEDNTVLYQGDFKYNFYTNQEIATICLELEKIKCKLMAMSHSIKPIFEKKSGDEIDKPDETP